MTNIDRRKFMARTGATAAAAGGLWLAPEIISPPAAFAADSCKNEVTTNFALASWTTPANNTNPQQTWIAAGALPAVTLSRGAVTAIGSPTATNNAGNGTFRTPTLTGYGVPNQTVLYFDFSAPQNAGYQTTFTFTQNVYKVRFTIYDIDKNQTGGQDYIDKVWVVPNSGVTVSAQATGITNPGTGAVGSELIGSTVDNTSTASALATITLTGDNAHPVTSFQVNYTNSITNNTGTRQVIGIGDITFCR